MSTVVLEGKGTLTKRGILISGDTLELDEMELKHTVFCLLLCDPYFDHLLKRLGDSFYLTIATNPLTELVPILTIMCPTLSFNQHL